MESERAEVTMEQLPIKVRHIDVEGLEHTPPKYVYSFLENVPNVATVGDLNQELRHSIHKLQTRNVFKKFDIEVDSSLAPDAGLNDVDVTVRVNEYSRKAMRIDVIPNREAGKSVTSVTGILRNALFGCGDQLTFNVSTDLGTIKPETISVKLDNIRVGENNVFFVGGSLLNLDKTTTSDYIMNSESGVVGLRSADQKHQLQYDASLRSLTPHGAPSTVVAQGIIPSFKSSLKYTYHHDLRSYSPGSTTASGNYCDLSVETSGGPLGGDVSVGKVEGVIQKNFAISDYVSLALTSRAGIAQPWSNFNKYCAKLKNSEEIQEVKYDSVPIFDRFFQNSLFVRGLAPREVGPRDGTSAVGGDIFTSFSASLSTCIPKYEGIGLRPHIFFNSGQVSSLTDFMNEKDTTKKCPLSDTTRMSTGFGFILPTPVGRIELNAASLINKTESGYSLTKPAFAFGASIDI